MRLMDTATCTGDRRLSFGLRRAVSRWMLARNSRRAEVPSAVQLPAIFSQQPRLDGSRRVRICSAFSPTSSSQRCILPFLPRGALRGCDATIGSYRPYVSSPSCRDRLRMVGRRLCGSALRTFRYLVIVFA